MKVPPAGATCRGNCFFGEKVPHTGVASFYLYREYQENRVEAFKFDYERYLPNLLFGAFMVENSIHRR